MGAKWAGKQLGGGAAFDPSRTRCFLGRNADSALRHGIARVWQSDSSRADDKAAERRLEVAVA